MIIMLCPYCNMSLVEAATHQCVGCWWRWT